MSIAGYGCLKHGREGYCRECSKIPVKPTYAELEQQLAEQKVLAWDHQSRRLQADAERSGMRKELASLRDENEGLLAAVEILGGDNAALLQEKSK